MSRNNSYFVIFIFTILMFTSGCSNNEYRGKTCPGKETGEKESKARMGNEDPETIVGKKIKLKAAYQTGSYPRFHVEEKDGKKIFSGMCIEMMEAVENEARDIDFIDDTALTPLARIKIGLERNIYQAAFGIARSPEREKLYRYTERPLYPVNFMVFALKSDKRARRINTLRGIEKHGGKIVGLRGTTALAIFKKKTENMKIPMEAVINMDQCINMVLKGRASFFTYNHIDAIGAMKKMGVRDKFIALPIITKKTYHWLAFSKEVPEDVVVRVNRGLRRLEKNGRLSEIYEKYTR